MVNIRLVANLVLVVFLLLSGKYAKAAQQHVLIVDAGALPGSKFYFLDRFDEWVQKNIFTFGISSLRLQSALAGASERISEIQILNARGALTNHAAQRILADFANDLFLAGSIVGSQLESGNNPVYQIRQTMGVVFPGKKALEDEIRENIFLSSDERSGLEDYLWKTETKTLELITGDSGAIPRRAMEELANQQIIYSEKDLAERKKELAKNYENGIAQFAGDELVAAGESGLELAKKFALNKDFKNSLDALADVRIAINLCGKESLLFGDSDPSNRGISEKIRMAEEIVNKVGILDVEEVHKISVQMLDHYNIDVQ